ncbi:hypothetical protein Q8W15_00740 [Photobacterium damselae subsp. piscicida]|nr:hypothetical protein [Photobacterium damselae subsp. piscicida]MDP2532081.1 hypothetical protein [Photobacterium damselae subsp. piscicida]MDP2543272.1 hypothetical protein [Photobacterium damselae subsp. piscicida]MDP2556295.1 hypothetical protein [Photobacterium damselae subsp. piscicida]MDP2570490.1 hypothetical protein [Photobacterium damselae subsp. piscicida]
MPKGARKGENRFKDSQDASVKTRVLRFEEHVVPKMKAMCDLVHIPNKTAFQKICAEVFNENLPVNMKEITHRAIATNAKYWSIVGIVYYSYYDSDDSKSLNFLKKEAVKKLEDKEKVEKLEQEKKSLAQENLALKAYISKSKLQDKASDENTTINHEVVNNLIATIDFLITATEGIVDINKEERSITNLALDINSVLSKSISCTYFNILEGKL